MSGRDDEVRRWVEAAQRGDREALARLFERHYDRIYRYALLRLGRVADAEDAAAETFARMVEGIGRFRWRRVPFVAWLFGIARHVVADQARGAARHREKEEVAFMQVWVEGPEDEALAATDVAAVRAALDGLSETQRQVLLLRFAGGLSSTEIGAALGKSSTAVRLQQMRALRILRERLEDER